MPQYSNSSYGSYSVTVPAGATNVEFFLAGAGGGDSNRTPPGTSWNNTGGWGRVGKFTLGTVAYDYTISFNLGQKGGSGSGSVGPGNPGGGGASSFASGGSGTSAGGGGGGASSASINGVYIAVAGAGAGAAKDGNPMGKYAGLGWGGGGQSGGISPRSGQSASAGNTGGGGGGCAIGVGTTNGNNYAGEDGNYPTGGGFQGYGGNSGWMTNFTSHNLNWTGYSGSNYNDGYYQLTFDLPAPTIDANVNPLQIVLGDSININWSLGGGTVNQVYLTSNDGVNMSFSPTTTYTMLTPTIGETHGDGSHHTSYTMTATGPGGSSVISFGITLYVPPIVNIIASSAVATPGDQITISWSTQDNSSANQAVLETIDVPTGNVIGYESVATTGTKTVTILGSYAPTIRYKISVSRSGPPPPSSVTSRLTDEDTVDVTVYEPPTVNLTATPQSIPIGSSFVLSWNTGGDADSVDIDQGVGTDLPVTGNVTLSPTQTTTYTAQVTGPGGANSDAIVVQVYPAPSLTCSGPPTVDFGVSSIPVQVTGTNSVSGIVVTPEYDGVAQTPISIPLSTGTTVQIYPYSYIPDWSTEPGQIRLNFVLYGHGSLEATSTVLVNILYDRLPDLITIPPSGPGLPDVDYTSPLVPISVDDINVPVEIMSSHPIQVEIDSDGTWQDVREIPE